VGNAWGKPSRRKALDSLKEPGNATHPGLWLDKYLWSPDKDDTKSKPKLVEEVIKAARGEKVKNAYQRYFQRHEAALAQHPGLTYGAVAKTQGRLSVGLGANAVLETSILLHRAYGVPYIPGSALKGLASSYAAKYLKDERLWGRSFDGGKTRRGELQKLIFGDTEESGLVIFFDALPDPKDFRLDPDAITVHHPDYYQGAKAPPADWDSPTPVPFITARGTFHFYLGLVPLPETEREKGRQLLELTARLLKTALEEEGVGAKTTLGYGRFTFEKDFEEVVPPPPPKSPALLDALEKVGFIRWSNDIGQRMREIAAIWAELKEEEKTELEQALTTQKARELGHPALKRARRQDANLDTLMKKLGP